MIDRLSKRDEEGVMGAIAESIKLANEGTDPSEAIAKVASAHGYNKHFATRMVEAFNVSKSLKHHKEASGEQKAENFDLADAGRVNDILFPAKVETPTEKSASAWIPLECGITDDKYFMEGEGPVHTKQAKEVYTWDRQDPDILMKRAYGELEHKQLLLKQAELEVRDLAEQATTSLYKIADHFRSTKPCEPFANFEAAALQSYGDAAAPAMNIVWEMSKAGSFGHKRAAGPAKVVPGVSVEPYQLLSNVMEKQQQYMAKNAALQDHRVSVTKDEAEVSLVGRLMAKAGQAIPLIGSYLANRAATNMKGDPAADGSVYDEMMKATEGLADPDMEAERKSIQAKMMLRNLMTSDEVISQQDPQAVVAAFNEIAALAPRAAESPMVMKSLLRRSLEQGSVDPMELTNITNLEKGMRENEQPSPMMQEVYKQVDTPSSADGSKSKPKPKSKIEA